MPAKTYPHNDLNERVSDGISLRWHYPNQVTGLGITAHSQPAFASSPVDCYQFNTYSQELQAAFCGFNPRGIRPPENHKRKKDGLLDKKMQNFLLHARKGMFARGTFAG